MTTEVETEASQESYYEEGYGEEDISGWALFAGMMMFGISLFAATAACAGFVNNSLIYEYSLLGTFFDWIWYGIFDGLIAIVTLYAGYSIWRGQKLGYWLGLIFATLSAGRWFLFIAGAPIWSLTMVVVWLLVIYGLIHDRKYFS